MNLPFFRKKKQVQQVSLSSVYGLLSSMLGLNYPQGVRNYSAADYQIAKLIVRPISDAINKIADHAIGIEAKIWDNKTNEYVELPDFTQLLSPPNSFCNYQLFLKTLVINYLTFGNAYYIISYVNGKPTSLMNVATKDVMIQANTSDGWPSVFTVSSQNIAFTRMIENGEIVFRNQSDQVDQKLAVIREASIGDSWKLQGESKINAVMADVSLYKAVYTFNQSLLDKQGMPCGLFKMQENVVLTDEQKNHLSEQFASQHAGAENAGKSMMLPPGIDYEQTSLSPKDIEYGQILDVVTKGVYNTFNIPLSLIESTALSLANMEIAMSHFYLNAVLPTTKTIFGSFTKELIPSFANDWQNIIVNYDERSVPALRGIQLDDLIKVSQLNALTPNEIRAELNRKSLPGGDDLLAPSDLVPLGDVDTDSSSGTDDSFTPAGISDVDDQDNANDTN